MTNVFVPPLAIHMPSFEMIVICLFAASLPVAFVIWMRGWLGSVKDENPDDVIREQAKADQLHLEHHHHHGHAHGHGPSHGPSHG